MSLRLRAVALTVVLIAGLLTLALTWPWISGEPATPTTGAAPVSASARLFSEGDRRNEVLRVLTQTYVTRGQDVSAGMRSGAELAPLAFLNAELTRQDAKWRVGSVAGLEAKLFDIS